MLRIHRLTTVCAFALCGTTGLLSCARPPIEEEPIQVVEVGGGPTDKLTPDGDTVEDRGARGFAGQLPPGFPQGLPIPPSSSVVRSSNGEVVFGTADTVEQATSDLERALSQAGWQAGDGGRYTRGGSAVAIEFQQVVSGPDAGGTWVTVRY